MDRLIKGEQDFQHRNVQCRWGSPSRYGTSLVPEALLLVSLNHFSALARPPIASCCFTGAILALFDGRGFEESEIWRTDGLERRDSIWNCMQSSALSLPSLLDGWSPHGPLLSPIELPRALGEGVRVSLFGFLDGHPCSQRDRTGSERVGKSSRREGLRQIKETGILLRDDAVYIYRHGRGRQG